MTAGSQVVVVGASLAGVRAAETLRGCGFAGRIVVVGAEPHFPPYDRPQLSKEALTSSDDPIRLRVETGLDLRLRLGRRAVALDVAEQRLHLDDDSELTYDGLVIATGATPRTLPGAADLTNVHVLRTVDDGANLRHRLKPGARLAVIGAGVLGCEIAATCRGLGLAVTVVDFLPQPMLRVLGPHIADIVADLHHKHGVKLLLGRQVLGFRGRPLVDGVLLDGDEVVGVDAVVAAVGVIPETDWLAGSGLAVADGVVCDEACFADGSDRTVVAAGDVARWRHPVLGTSVRVEHWTNAVAQGQAAAENLLAVLSGEAEPVPYAALPYYWSDQYGWKLQFVGSIGTGVAIADGSIEDQRFVAAYRSQGRLVGALCVNMPSQLARWRRQIAGQQAGN